MPSQKKGSAPVRTAFWDTSAVVPLCCFQSTSAKTRQIARIYGRQVVWWVTPVEAMSALQRLIREGHISQKVSAQSLTRLAYLRSRWSEIQPSDELREQAERLLRMHPLRAADALQLAAALIWCSHRPRGHAFIAGDSALSDAARIEGFEIVAV